MGTEATRPRNVHSSEFAAGSVAFTAKSTRASEPEPSAKPSTTSELRFPSLIESAYADPLLQTRSPVILEIQKNQVTRLSRIDNEKRAGNLGETNQGLLVVKTDKKILQLKLEKLVGEENRDRERLFEEFAKLNPMPEAQVRETFARSFQGQSPSGTWKQSADGEWARKP